MNVCSNCVQFAQRGSAGGEIKLAIFVTSDRNDDSPIHYKSFQIEVSRVRKRWSALFSCRMPPVLSLIVGVTLRKAKRRNFGKRSVSRMPKRFGISLKRWGWSRFPDRGVGDGDRPKLNSAVRLRFDARAHSRGF